MVTTIAAIISYRHAYQLVQRYGESAAVARVLPLTIDGLIATCSLVVLDCARHNRRPPRHAWALLAAGISATLGANIAHGIEHGIIGALVAGWPALVAVGSFELATHLLRSSQPSFGEEATVDETVRAPGVNASAAEDPALEMAQEVFAAVLSAGNLPTLRALKKELRIGHARATRVRAMLVEHARNPHRAEERPITEPTRT